MQKAIDDTFCAKDSEKLREVLEARARLVLAFRFVFFRSVAWQVVCRQLLEVLRKEHTGIIEHVDLVLGRLAIASAKSVETACGDAMLVLDEFRQRSKLRQVTNDREKRDSISWMLRIYDR